jgi:hypothetical protein
MLTSRVKQSAKKTLKAWLLSLGLLLLQPAWAQQSATFITRCASCVYGDHAFDVGNIPLSQTLALCNKMPPVGSMK